MRKTISIDIDLADFDDDDLIDELEYRGYVVDEQSENIPSENISLTDEEKYVIVNMMGIGKVGSIEYNIYEKLRKR